MSSSNSLPTANNGILKFPFIKLITLFTAATTAAAEAFAQRWRQPGHPRFLCHFSGISRASRRTKFSLQRLPPSHPPAISAEVMHFFATYAVTPVTFVASWRCRHNSEMKFLELTA
jgi:hypothetical protein